MVTGMTHQQALKMVHPRRKARQVYSTYFHTQGQAAFVRAGYKVKLITKPKRLTDLKKPTIILVNWQTMDCSHAVVWDPDKQKVYDPAYKKSLRKSLYLANFALGLEISPKK